MFNLATISVATVGASILTISSGHSGLMLRASHSESGSLVLLGLSLFAVAFVARRVSTRT
ncbi:MAG TPA: hypothetical protein VE222_07760 [Nitrospiraceae bacterium]|nr:hypothetical protein [Nitrospiraceae bacterium]